MKSTIMKKGSPSSPHKKEGDSSKESPSKWTLDGSIFSYFLLLYLKTVKFPCKISGGLEGHLTEM